MIFSLGDEILNQGLGGDGIFVLENRQDKGQPKPNPRVNCSGVSRGSDQNFLVYEWKVGTLQQVP